MSQKLGGTFTNAAVAAAGGSLATDQLTTRKADVSLVIPSTGTVVVERAADGVNFRTVNTYTASSEIVVEHATICPTRLRCTVAPPAGQDITWYMRAPVNQYAPGE